jgi:hypothetical protein
MESTREKNSQSKKVTTEYKTMESDYKIKVTTKWKRLSAVSWKKVPERKILYHLTHHYLLFFSFKSSVRGGGDNELCAARAVSCS